MVAIMRRLIHPSIHVLNFHRGSGLPFRLSPQSAYPPAEIEFRKTLITEETQELLDALDELMLDNTATTRANVLKEACDVVFVVFGTTVQLGLDAIAGFERVARSNMSKLDACDECESMGCQHCNDRGYLPARVREEDGKILKSERYLPPHLEDLVRIER